MIKELSLLVVLLPLLGSLIAGLFGKRLGIRGTQVVTILLMLASFVCSLIIFNTVVFHGNSFDGQFIPW